MARKKEKFIRSVPVLGHEMPVEYNVSQANLKADPDEVVSAMYDDSKRKILMSKAPFSAGADSDLLHEVLHAVLDISGFRQKMDSKEEEQLVVLLENALSILIDFKANLYT